MGLSPLDELARMPERERDALLDSMSPDELELIANADWSMTARPEQLPPPGDWLGWYIKAGRGFGKTRSGAEWTKDQVLRLGASADVLNGVRGALIAPTFGDIRDTMVEGESGLKSVLPPSMLLDGSWEKSWNRSLAELNLEGGHKLKGFSSEKPDRLRGPQHHFAWVEEPAYLKDASKGTADDTTWSNMLLGLRLPPDPRVVITGTPKRNRLIIEISNDPDIVVVTGSTYDNLANLSRQFRARVVARYQGTRLGRQELHAEILEGVGEVFQWGWFNHVSRLDWRPTKVVRYWDLAATEPHEGNRDPDWTAGAKVAIHEPTRRYAILHVVRFRLNSGARDDRIRTVARMDGPQVGVWIEQVRGADAKSTVANLARHLDGVARVKGNPVQHDKTDRAELWAGAAQQDRVEIVEGDWDQIDLKDEMDEFPNGAHDDMVDAVSGAFIVLGVGGLTSSAETTAGRSAGAQRPADPVGGGAGMPAAARVAQGGRPASAPPVKAGKNGKRRRPDAGPAPRRTVRVGPAR